MKELVSSGYVVQLMLNERKGWSQIVTTEIDLRLTKVNVQVNIPL